MGPSRPALPQDLLVEPSFKPRTSATKTDPIVAFEGSTMGTTYSVKFVPRIDEMERIVQAKVEATLGEVNATMSTYDESSELSLFNRTKADVPFVASQPLFFVLSLSKAVSTVTEGAFDVTVGPLVQAYGFGAKGSAELPSEERLLELTQHVGMAHLTLDEARRTVTKDNASVEVDLSAIAKGYGVDEVAEALETMGILNYLVEVGGEIRTRGQKPNQKSWTLAIERPDPSTRSVYMTLELDPKGEALATSGDYRNYRKDGERIVSHTMDPRVGRPVPRRTASASVIRPTAAEADALATAFCVLTPEESITLSDRHNYAVLLLVHDEDGGLVPMASRAFSIRYELPHP